MKRERATIHVSARTPILTQVHACRAGTQVASQYIAARLVKVCIAPHLTHTSTADMFSSFLLPQPPLVRDTSRRNVLLRPVQAIKSMFAKPNRTYMCL